MMRTLTTIAVTVLALATTACVGGASGGSEDAFCDELEETAPALFRNPTDLTVDPAIVGELRSVREVAPDSLRDEFETLTEAEDEDELDEALTDIQVYVDTECDIDTVG